MRNPRRSDRRAAACFLVVAGLLTSPAFAGDERVAAGGLLDLEGWKTNPGFEFPSRNDGELASDMRLRAWLVVNFGGGFDAFAQGLIEGGKGSVNVTSGPELEQGYIRYTYEGASRVVVEAGKITPPIGNFPPRYFSSVNPLIGTPYGYTDLNPTGVRVKGWAGPFDYTFAAVDRPWTYGADVPEPGSTLRPALAFGVTPLIGLRLGLYGTRGPYIDGEPGVDQAVAGVDLHFSRGYFVVNGDFSWSTYDVPDGLPPVHGHAFWVEPVYTWSPRVFTALRIESCDVPYVELEDDEWEAEPLGLFDVEASVGVRVLPQLVVKVSYRMIDWSVDPDLRADYPDGYALGAQVSYTFDIDAWFRRRQ